MMRKQEGQEGQENGEIRFSEVKVAETGIFADVWLPVAVCDSDLDAFLPAEQAIEILLTKAPSFKNKRQQRSNKCRSCIMFCGPATTNELKENVMGAKGNSEDVKELALEMLKGLRPMYKKVGVTVPPKRPSINSWSSFVALLRELYEEKFFPKDMKLTREYMQAVLADLESTAFMPLEPTPAPPPEPAAIVLDPPEEGEIQTPEITRRSPQKKKRPRAQTPELPPMEATPLEKTPQDVLTQMQQTFLQQMETLKATIQTAEREEDEASERKRNREQEEAELRELQIKKARHKADLQTMDTTLEEAKAQEETLTKHIKLLEKKKHSLQQETKKLNSSLAKGRGALSSAMKIPMSKMDQFVAALKEVSDMLVATQ